MISGKRSDLWAERPSPTRASGLAEATELPPVRWELRGLLVVIVATMQTASRS